MTVPEVLRQNFDRCVVIGLHRIDSFFEHLFPSLSPHSSDPKLEDWNTVDLFPAIDARKCKPPPYWTDIPALWACGESHRQVISRALSDGVESILIMEDDCRFTNKATEILPQFMAELPASWDGAMLGGQVSIPDGKTIPVSKVVSKCVQVERLHCYALSRSGMQKFHDILCENTNTPNDYRWGDAQEDGRLAVYRCEPFIAYQSEGRSSISGRIEANRIWDERVDVRCRLPEDVPVISLVCPFPVMERLRDEGIISNGGESPPFLGITAPGEAEKADTNVAHMMAQASRNNPMVLRHAVETLRYDASFHRKTVFALWHPSQVLPHDNAPVIRANNYTEAANAIAAL